MALDFCRVAWIHNNLTTCFFSLEMTRSEIMMRLLSAEAKVPLNHIRNGPTRDLTVAFQVHYSRFVDMAQG